jgi:hypothetical protein
LQRATAAIGFKPAPYAALAHRDISGPGVDSWVRPWMEKMGLGKLPGDFHFKLFGREWFIPLASTLLFSFVISLIAKFL